MYFQKTVSAKPIVFFRVLFGFVLFIETLRFWLHGWIQEYYIDPVFHFSYQAFSWVTPLPANGMHAVFFLMAVLALLLIWGKRSRVVAGSLLVLFGYIFLIDPVYYNNHYYLYLLILFGFTLLPSLNWHTTVRSWMVWFCRFIVALPFVFGAIAKLNGDWLVGQPASIWFPEGWGLFVSYAGLLFDFFIVPMLLHKKFRLLGVIAAIVFHVTNMVIFEIGMFPIFMLLAMPIFFEEKWFDRWVGRWVKTTNVAVSVDTPRWVYNVAVAFVVVQIFLPFRHLFIEGNVHWTTEGRRYSWHMKTVDKQGEIQFFLRDPQTNEFFSPDISEFLNPFQISVMSKHPDMIVQFAKHLHEVYRERDEIDYIVNVIDMLALNGREPQLLIDPRQDLAKTQPSLGHDDWILPLEQT